MVYTSFKDSKSEEKRKQESENIRRKYPDRIPIILEKFDNKDILHGLGELLSAKQKDWVRNNLKKDLIFQLKNYADTLRRTKNNS